MDVNCDGAFHKATHRVGIDALCRNHYGIMMKGWHEPIKANSNFIAELLAVKKPLFVAADFSDMTVIGETDGAKVFK